MQYLMTMVSRHKVSIVLQIPCVIALISGWDHHKRCVAAAAAHSTRDIVLIDFLCILVGK